MECRRSARRVPPLPFPVAVESAARRPSTLHTSLESKEGASNSCASIVREGRKGRSAVSTRQNPRYLVGACIVHIHSNRRKITTFT